MSKNWFQVVALGKKSHGRKSHLIWKRKIILKKSYLSPGKLILVPRSTPGKKLQHQVLSHWVDRSSKSKDLDLHCCFRQLKGKWFLTVLFLILPPPTCACRFGQFGGKFWKFILPETKKEKELGFPAGFWRVGWRFILCWCSPCRIEVWNWKDR